MARRIRHLKGADVPRPRIGMRLWLGATFAVVGVITAGTVYRFVDDSTESVVSDRSSELAVGRTIHVADRVGEAAKPAEVIDAATDAGFQAWYFNRDGSLVAPDPPGPALAQVPARRRAVSRAVQGGRFIADLPGNITVVSFPVFRQEGISGALLGRYSRPEVLQGAIDRLRRDSIRALAVGVAIAILIGFLVSTLITFRIKRLARSAEEMAAGSLDVPLDTSGSDEVGDLARALDAMRAALRDSFQVLSSDRDRLAAIFDGLIDPVMVIDNDGTIRFSNPAAAALATAEEPPLQMVPYLRHAAERGRAEVSALPIGERIYALVARDLPAERAVLVVVRDRTDEIRRELSEREFVSNAAHELRNPLAGISGAIEVLRAGAKDDPEAREHFLRRLTEDVDRMSRLIQSLLALARVEALGEGEAEVVDVAVAAQDAVSAVQPDGDLELIVDVEPDLCARADPTLLRQVLIGLLSNALKATSAPGTITVRGRRGAAEEVILEVSDTGIGIPVDEVDRVFERFYRASGSLDHEGFGLGLAIAKRMVDVMGGEIGATSMEGEGSTFWVRLPLAEASRTPVA